MRLRKPTSLQAKTVELADEQLQGIAGGLMPEPSSSCPAGRGANVSHVWEEMESTSPGGGLTGSAFRHLRRENCGFTKLVAGQANEPPPVGGWASRYRIRARGGAHKSDRCLCPTQALPPCDLKAGDAAWGVRHLIEAPSHAGRCLSFLLFRSVLRTAAQSSSLFTRRS